jgi:hypothetical protein
MAHLRAPALRTDIELKLLRRRMDIQDRLEPGWRALIYEHGQMRVFELLESGVTDPDDALDYLA